MLSALRKVGMFWTKLESDICLVLDHTYIDQKS